VNRALVVAPAILTALVASACEDGDRVDLKDAEGKIAASLDERTGARPRSVNCPGTNPQARKGATFRCTVTAEDGQRFNLVATITDDSGSFSYRVERTALP
jgi:hypothetical protein